MEVNWEQKGDMVILLHCCFDGKRGRESKLLCDIKQALYFTSPLSVLSLVTWGEAEFCLLAFYFNPLLFSLFMIWPLLFLLSLSCKQTGLRCCNGEHLPPCHGLVQHWPCWWQLKIIFLRNHICNKVGKHQCNHFLWNMSIYFTSRDILDFWATSHNTYHQSCEQTDLLYRIISRSAYEGSSVF